jgi:hypothetical protein
MTPYHRLKEAVVPPASREQPHQPTLTNRDLLGFSPSALKYQCSTWIGTASTGKGKLVLN